MWVSLSDLTLFLYEDFIYLEEYFEGKERENEALKVELVDRHGKEEKGRERDERNESGTLRSRIQFWIEKNREAGYECRREREREGGRGEREGESSDHIAFIYSSWRWLIMQKVIYCEILREVREKVRRRGMEWVSDSKERHGERKHERVTREEEKKDEWRSPFHFFWYRMCVWITKNFFPFLSRPFLSSLMSLLSLSFLLFTLFYIPFPSSISRPLLFY